MSSTAQAHGAGDVRRTLALAGPLVLGQLAGVLMTFVDTVMAGRLSAAALASVAAGAAIWHTSCWPGWAC